MRRKVAALTCNQEAALEDVQARLEGKSLKRTDDTSDDANPSILVGWALEFEGALGLVLPLL